MLAETSPAATGSGTTNARSRRTGGYLGTSRTTTEPPPEAGSRAVALPEILTDAHDDISVVLRAADDIEDFLIRVRAEQQGLCGIAEDAADILGVEQEERDGARGRCLERAAGHEA